MARPAGDDHRYRSNYFRVNAVDISSVNYCTSRTASLHRIRSSHIFDDVRIPYIVKAEPVAESGSGIVAKAISQASDSRRRLRC